MKHHIDTSPFDAAVPEFVCGQEPCIWLVKFPQRDKGMRPDALSVTVNDQTCVAELQLAL